MTSQPANANLHTQATYLLERLRAIPAGIIESTNSTFFLLIALQALQADSLSKSLILAGGNIGLLLTPWVVMWVARSGQPVMRVAAWLMGFGTIALIIAAAFPILPIYIAAAMLAYALTNMVIPLFTPVYQANYAPRERGKYVSRAIVVRVAVAALYGELAGRLLTLDVALFRIVLVIAAVSFAASAFIISRIPSQPIHANASAEQGGLKQILQSMSFLRTDKLLRNTMTAWMLMGFANLMMMPLRVEYLANPIYGINLNAQQTAFLTVVIPSLARLVMSPIFGWVFDRLNFFATRVALNIAFAISILAFFTGNSYAGLVIGSLVFGIAIAGGDITWSLWVTKFAPPARVADYMSVHTFFTGIRGVLAPLLAFQLITRFPVGQIGLLCAVMIGLASLILVPEVRFRRDGPVGCL
ncbi:MAG: MFS transporter [Anaerolineae bacterium]|nr:MFS transporter [Anaerolineae bacterium]